jgi:hypothetical protein
MVHKKNCELVPRRTAPAAAARADDRSRGKRLCVTQRKETARTDQLAGETRAGALYGRVPPRVPRSALEPRRVVRPRSSRAGKQRVFLSFPPLAGCPVRALFLFVRPGPNGSPSWDPAAVAQSLPGACVRALLACRARGVAAHARRQRIQGTSRTGRTTTGFSPLLPFLAGVRTDNWWMRIAPSPAPRPRSPLFVGQPMHDSGILFFFRFEMNMINIPQQVLWRSPFVQYPLSPPRITVKCIVP